MVNDAEVTIVTNARRVTDVHPVPKMELTKPEMLDPDPHTWNLEEDNNVLLIIVNKKIPQKV